MQKQKTIKCAFCKGTGVHPYFTGTCPVCKGRGENQIVGKYMTCQDCRGLGQKRGTTLTCYTCGGLGVVPDTREIVAKAKEEIKKAQEEMEEERKEFREKPQSAPPLPKAQARGPSAPGGDQPLAGKKWTKKKIDRKKKAEEVVNACPPVAPRSAGCGRESEVSKEELFCQCCARKVKKESTIKVCLDCFQRIKEAWRENIFTES